MRIVIVTGSAFGTAPVHLDRLATSGVCEIAGVILCGRRVTNRKKQLWKKLRKVVQIGIGGAIAGVVMRRWFGNDMLQRLPQLELRNLCLKHRIALFETPGVNTTETLAHIRTLDADLGISLGNSYIGKKIFTAFRLGMVNIHHEMLPDYQNAQSVLWQLYNGSRNTGYTIHKVESKIDAGEILLQEEVPVIFESTLRRTVSATYADLIVRSAIGLEKLVSDYDTYSRSARVQESGRSYTTPSIWQFLKMVRNHRKMRNTA